MTNYLIIICYFFYGDKMKVKVIDANHENDLEKKVNSFLKENKVNVIDIKFSNCCMKDKDNDQIYCFSALIIYQD